MPKTFIMRKSWSCQGNTHPVKTVFATNDNDNDDVAAGNSDDKPTANEDTYVLQDGNNE